MNIYFSGDSNTAGTQLSDPMESFAYVLGKKLGSTSIVVEAVAGGSNDKILRDTQSYLSSNTDVVDFVVIGWTSPEREDWFINGNYRSLNKFELFQEGFDLEKDERYDFYLKNQANNGNYHAEMQKYWHSKIYNYHLELTYNKIPHLFFNAIYSFALFNHGKTLFHHDWNNVFLAPYDHRGSMVDFCQDAGYQEITPGWYHFNKHAHQEWAEVLYQHIKTHNLI
jgi:hypothetical protein